MAAQAHRFVNCNFGMLRAPLLAVTSVCLLLNPAISASEERALPYGRIDACATTNRGWMDTHPIPASMPYLSEYVESTLALNTEIESLLTESLQSTRPSRAQRNVGAFYRSFNDQRSRNVRRLAPLQHDLDAIESLQRTLAFPRWFAHAGRRHRDLIEGSISPAPVPFLVQDVWLDPQDRRRMVPYLASSGLGLPDPSYYVAEDERTRAIRASYIDHVSAALRLAGRADAAREAQRVFAVEVHLAKAMISSRSSVTLPPGLYGTDDLRKLVPHFDWRVFWRGAGLSPRQELYVLAPAYVAAVGELLRDDPAGVIHYLRWQLLRHYSPYLSADFQNSSAEFYGTLNGRQELPDSKQTSIELLPHWMSEDIAVEYARRFGSPDKRNAARNLAEEIRLAFRSRVSQATWLDEVTRSEALRKIDDLQLQISHSDERGEQTALRLSTTNLVGNLQALSIRAYERKLARLRVVSRGNVWLASPATITGAYSQTANTLMIAAGRLRPPLFDPAVEDASNYGGLGTLIGHEMAHALDTIGSRYDASGRLRQWWSVEAMQEFQRRTQRIAAQFSQYEPLPGIRVDGERTLAENIADMAGLSVAFEALRLKRLQQGRELSSQDQAAFFASWSTRWRVRYTEPLLAQVLQRDTHAPLQYRCIGPLSNFTPFYEFGGILPGDADYRMPADRITVW